MSAIRAQIIRRGALIFLFGLLINGFPYFTWGDVPGIADPTLLQRMGDRLLHWRVLGVLQRIGDRLHGGGTADAAHDRSPANHHRRLSPVRLLDRDDRAARARRGDDRRAPARPAWPHHGGVVDRLVLDWSRVGLGNHLWASSVTWDPEGVLSTIPAIGTAMLGNLAGRWIGERRPLSERLAGLSSAGALGMMTGLMWHWSFPINKSLWTSSYVLFAAGMAAVALSTVMWIVDFNRVRRFTKFFVVYGTNPIVAFVGSAVMARCIYSIFKVDYGGTRIPLQEGIYRALFASWLSPINASLAFAVAFVLFWYGVLYELHRRGIILKV